MTNTGEEGMKFKPYSIKEMDEIFRKKVLRRIYGGKKLRVSEGGKQKKS